jgi:hypothetical protein
MARIRTGSVYFRAPAINRPELRERRRRAPRRSRGRLRPPVSSSLDLRGRYGPWGRTPGGLAVPEDFPRTPRSRRSSTGTPRVIRVAGENRSHVRR